MKQVHHSSFLPVLSMVAALLVFVASFLAFSHSDPGKSGIAVSERAVAAATVPAARTLVEATPVRNVVRTEAAPARPAGAGEASYYGNEFAGRPTANGEPFDPSEMTAAHRTLPFGSKVRVTNVRNGRTVIVRINDRGPYAKDRLIDVSQGAAQELGMMNAGTADVRLEVIS